MTTATSTRFAGFLSAAAMTLALNGGMLWAFNDVATEAPTATAVVTLDTVTIVGKRA